MKYLRLNISPENDKMAVIMKKLLLALLIGDIIAAPLVEMNGGEEPTFISNYLSVSVTGNTGTNPYNSIVTQGYWASAGDTSNSPSSTNLHSSYTIEISDLPNAETVHISELSFNYGRYTLQGSTPIMNVYLDQGTGYGEAIYTVSNTPPSNSDIATHAIPIDLTLQNGDSVTFGFSFADVHSLQSRTHVISELSFNGSFNLTEETEEAVVIGGSGAGIELAKLTGESSPESLSEYLTLEVNGNTGVNPEASVSNTSYWTSASATGKTTSSNDTHTVFQLTASGLSASEKIDLTSISFDYLKSILSSSNPSMEVYITTDGNSPQSAIVTSTTNEFDEIQLPLNLSLSNGQSLTVSFSFSDIHGLASRTHMIDNFILYGYTRLNTDAVGVDLNRNGVSDVWERLYLAGELVSDDVSKNQDADGDGVSNYNEGLAGTNPYSKKSNHISSIKGSGDELMISIPTERGKKYTVLGSADLNSDPWKEEFSSTIATDDLMDLMLDITDVDRYFFNVVVGDVDQDGDGLTRWEEENLSGYTDTTDTDNDYESAVNALTAQESTISVLAAGGVLYEKEGTSSSIKISRTDLDAPYMDSVLNFQILSAVEVASNSASGLDYYLTDSYGNTLVNGEITLNQGESSVTVFVHPIKDNESELDEQLILSIQGKALPPIWISDSRTISSSDFIATSQAGHFLSQASMGGTPETISQLAKQIQTVGYIKACEDWIDDQLTLPRETSVSDDCLSFQAQYINSESTPSINIQNFELVWWGKMIQTEEQLRNRIAFSLSQIFVTSSAFWANSERTNLWLSYTEYYDLLMDNAYNTHRELLGAITYNPFMGVYLSYAQNRKADSEAGTVPDENFAREVMQLFSCGVYTQDQSGNYLFDPSSGDQLENYDNADIVELAQVFTGLGLVKYDGTLDTFLSPKSSYGNRYTYPMQMEQSYHDESTKILLDGTVLPAGQSGDADISDSLDRLALHSSTAPHISRLLIKRLTSSNPSGEYISRVTEAWRGMGEYGNGEIGNLTSVIKAILLDPEARYAIDYSVDSSDKVSLEPVKVTSGRIKEPILKWTQFYRFSQSISGSDETDELYFAPKTKKAANDMTPDFGQIPMRADSVFNYYDSDFSQSIGPIKEARDNLGVRVTAPEAEILSPYVIKQFETFYKIANSDTPESSFTYGSIAKGNIDFTVNHSYLTYLYNKNETIGGFIDDVNLWLCNGQISEELKQQLVMRADANRGATRENMSKILTILFNSSDFSVSY